ncbi:hypothetical protein [Sphingomonas sp. LT1P40]|uniref:hypothetical protein n=1 Tax=Alteristakelama amylovorans TaxID=3096166 RepID=UPI002FCC314B
MSIGSITDLSQHRVQRHFADHRALAPGDAIEYVPSGPAERKAFDTMIERGVIRQTSPATYWFDLDRMGRTRRQPRDWRWPVAIAFIALVAGVAMYIGRF